MKYQMYDNPIFAIPSESEGWFFLAEKRNMTLNDFISSGLAPLSGELPKAEGAAQAVYFAMNTASVRCATCS